MKKSTGLYGIVIGNFVLVLLVISIVVLVLLLKNLDKSVDQMSQDRLDEMLSRAEEELQSFFRPVEYNMRVTRHRVEEGLFQNWNASLFTSYFYPLLHNTPQVSSAMLATSDGRELLILDMDSVVLNRYTDIVADKSSSSLIYFRADSAGRLRKIKELKQEEAYDPRSRPWFIEGMKGATGDITWTSPYSFYTTGEPGITAVLKWRNLFTGFDVLLAYDLLIEDISWFTTTLQPSKNSRVFVIDEDNRCIGLPYDVRFNHADSIAKYSLQPIEQLHIPAVSKAISLQKKAGPGSTSFSFPVGEEIYWVGFKMLEMGSNRHFIIGAIVPESDFLARMQGTKRQIFGGFGIIMIIIFVMAYSYLQKRRDNKAIHLEKEKNETLLLNTLPAKVVHDLMESGTYKPERFNMISVMFVDIVDFTSISAGMDPGEIIDELNEMYTAFDEIIDARGCERIKTIGDAYMAVSGMPNPNPEHAVQLLSAAFDIVHHMRQRNVQSSRKWNIRIGIHSGGVVGGIVGKKKYLYDIFGDTINTASRMESSAKPMRINLSDTTRQLVQASSMEISKQYTFTARPLQEVKGKGAVQMYFAQLQHEKAHQ